MTTFAALQDAERELEARTHAAWTAYSDALRGLDRIAYEDAEPAAWDQLQATLREARRGAHLGRGVRGVGGGRLIADNAAPRWGRLHLRSGMPVFQGW